MKREEIWWVNFDPSVGGEIRKKRPAVIVSNDLSNKYLNRLQVVPLSSQINKIYPTEVPIDFKQKPHKCMCDQLTTVSKLRVIEKVGKVSEAEMRQIELAIRLQLSL